MEDIEEKLLGDISDYCQINGIQRTPFINRLLKDAFMREKYGEKPGIFNRNEETIATTNEKDVEVIVEDVICDTVDKVTDKEKTTKPKKKVDAEKNAVKPRTKKKTIESL